MTDQTELSDAALSAIAARVGDALKAQGLMLATAESCTGGWIAQACTSVAGSSEWFERGFVTYTYISKREMLGVAQETLGVHGAVSELVVREMVAGVLANSHAQIAVAVSGTAGPSGGTPEKPVGTLCLAWCLKNGEPRCTTLHLKGDREAIRRQAVRCALAGILELLPAPK